MEVFRMGVEVVVCGWIRMKVLRMGVEVVGCGWNKLGLEWKCPGWAWR